MNRHQFEQAAKSFRAGRITISQFAEMLFPASGNSGGRSAEKSTFSEKELVQTLIDRPEDSHKGDFGRVLVIGGSAGMPGSISLTGKAALRTGSGLVVVGTTVAAAAAVSGFSPCYMVESYSLNDDADEIMACLADRIAWADVVAAGPGMTTSTQLLPMIKQLYHEYEKPVVLDADALNLMSAEEGFDFTLHAGPRVLTPHPGEFSRMTRLNFESRQQMNDAAIEFAAANSVCVVLKGNRTTVSDGKASWNNSTGNPGMATAGSGDVLTGMIASLIGQKMAPMDAACLGVYLHGRAGDIAKRERGIVSLIATDVLDAIAPAIASCLDG
ncbi:MAG: NAD(P)H-hydrate dehydratase [Planctomycetota bacterium]